MPASPMPATLDAFTDWLMTDTAVFGDVPTRLRMRPEGDPASNLMIVTDCPEAGDVVAVRLLTGDAGQLFDTMLKALGRDRSSIYLATLAPSRPPSGRVDQAAVAALIPALRRHLALVRPAKLWLLGDAASRAVLALDAGAASGRLHSVNQDGATINTIATLHPRVLLREPKAKARAWEDMQRLMGLRN